MKKLLSLVILAIVALVATTLTSCGSDNDDDSNKAFMFKMAYDVEVKSTDVQNAVANFYKNLLGSNATVASVTSAGFTISGQADKKETVISLLKGVDTSDLSNTLDDLFCIKDLSYTFYNDEDKIICRHIYSLSTMRMVQGTYTATIGGKTFKLEIKDATTDTSLNAVCTVDGTETYEGTVYLGGNFCFLSADRTGDECTVNLQSHDTPYNTFSEDFQSFTVYYVTYKSVTYDTVTFTRQK